MSLYIEYLSSRSFLTILRNEISSLFGNKKIINHYYIDATLLGEKMANIFGRIFGCQFKILEFRMIDIKDENGELIRLRIPRVDIQLIQKNILNSDSFKSLFNNEWAQDRFLDYLKKGIVPVDRNHENSAFKIIFIIQVIIWHMEKREVNSAILYVNNCAWLDIYTEYALHYGVKIKSIKRNLIKDIKNVRIADLLRKYPKLYYYLKHLGLYPLLKRGKSESMPKIYLTGRGDLNFENNGHHSDFYWYLNSDFPSQNILYRSYSKDEKLLLKNEGINVLSRHFIKNFKNYNRIPNPICRNGYRSESKLLKNIVESYNFNKIYWANFFLLNKVKIFQTWFKYDNSHIVMSDAIREIGGIAAINQLTFDGIIAYDCLTITDIVFGFSKYSYNYEKKLKSKIPYFVITGYPRDYATPILKSEAELIREKLKSNGAEKIVFVIDERGGDDERWHTGHGLQLENYSFIIEKLLENPWLGVVFKPKAPASLRRRLGDNYDLVIEAIKTGRCYIYEKKGRHTSIIPPLLAGLSADVCIHGHLSAGTAALECAFEGIPTLLIDREGCPESKFYELPKGKVIFNNWPDAIDAVMEYFQSKNDISGFGDWSQILDELDPFRDGKAANRMGSFLHDCIKGFKVGLDREVIMADAAQRYIDKWGDDKILSL